MRKPSLYITFLGLITLLVGVEPSHAQMAKEKATADEWIAANGNTIKEVNKKIWEFAELGLQEHKSSKTLIELLAAHGFQVERSVADMPTAFVASYGSGKPVVAILAEYDALPGLSQKAIDTKEARPGITTGHGCGHSLFGTASSAAAIAARYAIEEHQLKGTIRLYGCPAEETGIGKVFMTYAGLFDDCDIALHWHPKARSYAEFGSSKALVSVRFSFEGLTAHSAGGPERGRSALDAVELMNVGVNFLREHMTEDARIHYVITDGGEAPNVVPPTAQVWYFVRANRHSDMRSLFQRVCNIAKGAALMTDTAVNWRIETDLRELLPNRPLAELIDRNLRLVGSPQFTESEKRFARKTQEPLEKKMDVALYEDIVPLPDFESTKGSTDAGNVSWAVPTGCVYTTCYTYGAPGHSWQVVACSGMSIGEKGMMVAARTLACTAVELLADPDLVEAAKAEFLERKAGEEIVPLIPEGQKPPQSIQ